MPAVDLDRMTVPQLTALISAAEATRRDKLEEAKTLLRAEMERKAAELGIAPRELFSTDKQQGPRGKEASPARKPRENEGAKRAAKYRGPTGEEWSGRGREPGWLKALIAHGHSKDAYRVA